jgi:hypothetical protein
MPGACPANLSGHRVRLLASWEDTPETKAAYRAYDALARAMPRCEHVTAWQAETTAAMADYHKAMRERDKLWARQVEKVMTIGFAAHLMPLVRAGIKTLTYRAGEKWRTVSPGQELNAGKAGRLIVTSVRQVAFGDLPVICPGHETYAGRHQMNSVFAGYYGRDIPDEEIMTVLEFRQQ